MPPCPADLILGARPGHDLHPRRARRRHGPPHRRGVARAPAAPPRARPRRARRGRDPAGVARVRGRGAVEVDPARVAGVGIANQRETIVLWERATGRPVAPALVWQDARTAERCAQLTAAGAEDLVRRRTGLTLQPYFSATKLAWLLDNVPGARDRADAASSLRARSTAGSPGTLTGSGTSATSRTPRVRCCSTRAPRVGRRAARLFGIPRALLPEVVPTWRAGGLATITRAGPLAGLPLLALLGDQQAALLGQALPANRARRSARTARAPSCSRTPARAGPAGLGPARLARLPAPTTSRPPTASRAHPPWPAGRSGGWPTSSACSTPPRRPRSPPPSIERRRARRPGVPGPVRAVVGCDGARRDPRPDAPLHGRARGARDARGARIPDARRRRGRRGATPA